MDCPGLVCLTGWRDSEATRVNSERKHIEVRLRVELLSIY